MRSDLPVGLICAALLATTATAQVAEHTKDSLDTVKKAVAENKAVLVDVREKSEWDDGHLKNATSLPLSMLKDGAKTEDISRVLPAGKIVYCHCVRAARSLKAADAAQETRLRRQALESRLLRPAQGRLPRRRQKPSR